MTFTTEATGTRMADGSDALSAALKMSFGNGGISTPAGGFPTTRIAQGDSKSELQDMLNQSPETQFLSRPQPSASPTPSPIPSPSAAKPTQMSLVELMNHFGVANPVAGSSTSSNRPVYQNKPDQQIYDWRSQYGWSGLYS